MNWVQSNCLACTSYGAKVTIFPFMPNIIIIGKMKNHTKIITSQAGLSFRGIQNTQVSPTLKSHSSVHSSRPFFSVRIFSRHFFFTASFTVSLSVCSVSRCRTKESGTFHQMSAKSRKQQHEIAYDGARWKCIMYTLSYSITTDMKQANHKRKECLNSNWILHMIRMYKSAYKAFSLQNLVKTEDLWTKLHKKL